MLKTLDTIFNPRNLDNAYHILYNRVSKTEA